MSKVCSFFVLIGMLLSASPSRAQKPQAAGAAPYDLQFIDMMHHHHADGIMMAKHEEEHGQVSEVKALAAKIRAGQQKDQEQLEAIRKRLYGDRPMAMDAQIAGMSMKAMQTKSQTDMKKLMAASRQTDPVFVAVMTAHHQDAIKMSQDAVKRTADNELKQLAQQMLAMQTKELKELQTHKGHGAEHGNMDKDKMDQGGADHGKK